jgi:hypothetical protein
MSRWRIRLGERQRFAVDSVTEHAAISAAVTPMASALAKRHVDHGRDGSRLHPRGGALLCAGAGFLPHFSTGAASFLIWNGRVEKSTGRPKLERTAMHEALQGSFEIFRRQHDPEESEQRYCFENRR